MPRCCGGSVCGCKFQSSGNITITGSGSSGDPYVLIGNLNLANSSNVTFKSTIAGSGTAGDPHRVDVTFNTTAKLDHLPDVNAPSPSNGWVLGFNTISQKWEAQGPTTAAAGSVLHDTSLSGDGSAGSPLQVNEDAARFLQTAAGGLGLTDAGLQQWVLHYANASARTAATVPPKVANSLSMLADNLGEIDYWNGSAWVPIEDKIGTQFLGGELLALSGGYAGQRLYLVVKQFSITTDASGVFDVLSAADLTGRSGVIGCAVQPKAASPGWHANIYGATTKVSATAWRADTGAAYVSQALTGLAIAVVY